MKLLIIGANGFLGRNLVKRCLELDWSVDCVYKDDKGFIPKQCVTYHIDDLEKIDKSYDVVFLLSAFIPYGKFEVYDKELLEVNIKIPLRVVDKFTRSKIIFSSSVSVYGTHDSTIVEESSFNNPNAYALSKLAGECILRFGKNYQIIRFSSLYGTGMNAQTFIPKILKEAREDGKITIFGNGSRLQNYLYIEDAVGYLIAALSQKQSGFYLGVFGRSYLDKEVAEIIQGSIDECKIEFTGGDNSSSYVYNNSYTNEVLKFTPQYPLDKGIRKMLTNE